jgi:hypothetical protein
MNQENSTITLSFVPHAAEELRHRPPLVEAQAKEDARLERRDKLLWQHIYAAADLQGAAVACREGQNQQTGCVLVTD